MPPTYTVARVGDLREGHAKVVRAGSREVALVLARGTYTALSNVCRHRGGPVGQGEVDAEENTVACPWHGWEYDLATGKATLNPLACLDRFPVDVVGDEIRVTVA